MLPVFLIKSVLCEILFHFSCNQVEDEKLSMSEKNDVDTEAMQEKNDESAADLNQTEQCQEEINADDVLQLETEENSFDKIEETASHEETEISSTTATEAVTINDDITDKVSKSAVINYFGVIYNITKVILIFLCRLAELMEHRLTEVSRPLLTLEGILMFHW
jgi:hypothetical protein